MSHAFLNVPRQKHPNPMTTPAGLGRLTEERASHNIPSGCPAIREVWSRAVMAGPPSGFKSMRGIDE